MTAQYIFLALCKPVLFTQNRGKFLRFESVSALYTLGCVFLTIEPNEMRVPQVMRADACGDVHDTDVVRALE